MIKKKENELKELLKKANKQRQQAIDNCNASYCIDVFLELSNFILKNLGSFIFRKQKVEMIVEHFDEILPYVVSSNIDIFLIYSNILIEQTNFKRKFIEGLKKYPYKDGINEIFYNIWYCLGPVEFDVFLDSDIFDAISTIDVESNFYTNILNKLSEEKQKDLLGKLIKNRRIIQYSAIEYKGNNKQLIYDNISLFIENSENLYSLMNFVKNNSDALSQVKKYIDNNEEKAINSIFCETEKLKEVKDSTLKEIIKLLILEVIKNENVKLSDITYNSGGYSRVLLIGDKVIKLGNRATKSFPNNPYIVSPLLRKELKGDNETCFVEITERVDTSDLASSEELYHLFKDLRNLGLVWTDIKPQNVGRLKKENIIHWPDELNPNDQMLGLDTMRGTTVLKKGDLVIIDADFIFDEKDTNIVHTNMRYLYDEFESRYQKEKKELGNKEHKNVVNNTIEETDDYEINASKGIRR